ncbi:hypothetical protein HAX54_047172 [Datura stramonium]|uniref:Uncharacterized protein n=1 Tax=Datura stramonium TaxID=4076 RepID=A0ABS8SSK9_DATST|nr:hypothetical protein [Datura stramonium]
MGSIEGHEATNNSLRGWRSELFMMKRENSPAKGLHRRKIFAEGNRGRGPLFPLFHRYRSYINPPCTTGPKVSLIRRDITLIKTPLLPFSHPLKLLCQIIFKSLLSYVSSLPDSIQRETLLPSQNDGTPQASAYSRSCDRSEENLDDELLARKVRKVSSCAPLEQSRGRGSSFPHPGASAKKLMGDATRKAKLGRLKE